MHYAYGDSSDSPFTSNILEFLRDAIDFSVYVLEADQRIQTAHERIEKLRQQTGIELEQIETLTKIVLSTIEETPKGADDSPAVTCADRMNASCHEAARSTTHAVRQRLADQVAQADAKEAAERDGCLNALVALLAAHAGRKERKGGQSQFSVACRRSPRPWRKSDSDPLCAEPLVEK